MGPYELSAELVHGYPRYSKRAAGGKTHWLYWSSTSGKWLADDESGIAKNRGDVASARAAALPTEAGLVWRYYNGTAKAWQDDPKITCTEVPPRAPALHARPSPRSAPPRSPSPGVRE